MLHTAGGRYHPGTAAFFTRFAFAKFWLIGQKRELRML